MLTIPPLAGSLALFAYVAANGHDAPSPDDDDLMLERPTVADADNGFADLSAAAAALQASERSGRR